MKMEMVMGLDIKMVMEMGIVLQTIIIRVNIEV